MERCDAMPPTIDHAADAGQTGQTGQFNLLETLQGLRRKVKVL